MNDDWQQPSAAEVLQRWQPVRAKLDEQILRLKSFTEECLDLSSKHGCDPFRLGAKLHSVFTNVEALRNWRPPPVPETIQNEEDEDDMRFMYLNSLHKKTHLIFKAMADETISYAISFCKKQLAITDVKSSREVSQVRELAPPAHEWEFDDSTGSVTFKGVPFRLRGRVYDVLKILALAKRPISDDDISKALRGNCGKDGSSGFLGAGDIASHPARVNLV